MLGTHQYSRLEADRARAQLDHQLANARPEVGRLRSTVGLPGTQSIEGMQG